MMNLKPLLVGIVMALITATAACADNYVVKDGTGALQTFGSKAAGGVQQPVHICASWFSGGAVLCNIDGSGNQGVNVQNTPTVNVGNTPTVNLGTLGGGATAALQTTANGYLASLAGTVSGSTVNVTCSGCGSGSNAAASLTGAAVPTYAGYTGVNFSGNLKGWVGDTNGYGDVNVMNTPAVTVSGVSTAANQSTELGYLHSLALTVSGTNLNVVCTSGCGGGGGGSNAAASATGAAVPAFAGYTGLNFGGNLKGWVGDTNGYGYVDIADGQDITLGAKADAAWSGSGSGSAVAILKALWTAATGALPAGANTVGAVNQAGTWTVQPGNTPNTSPWLTTETPGTAGGLSTYILEPAASDNHANIKNGAGQVYHIDVSNNSATVNYLRLYNAASGFNGCNSATNLMWEVNIPASTSGARVAEPIPEGLAFSTGISICVTGAYGQTNTTNATASAISVNIGYK